MNHSIYFIFLFFIVNCLGCNEADRPGSQKNLLGDDITRKNGTTEFVLAEPEKRPRPPYPWEKGRAGNLPKISKEFFRCRGSHLNPERSFEKNGKIEIIRDCGGSDKHSLPIRDGKEFIYPILVRLTNHIQAKTGRRVVITSGHRCPEHNAYVDQSPGNRFSKHMNGAEVSFYVQGLEQQYDKIVEYLKDFYLNDPVLKDNAEYTQFLRYEREDTNTSIKPWYNKEIFIKVFKANEGRNFDNRHPYPYISLQVRYDRDLNQRVVYNWDQASQGFLRH